MQKNNVIIIGGGLAGLTAGIHLSSKGIDVTIIEKNNYPKHKVCGEYISNEVLEYFKSLDICLQDLEPALITNLHFSGRDGTSLKAKLPLGGFGLSRFALDKFLFEKAIQNGCTFINDIASSIEFCNDEFTVQTVQNNTYNSKILIGAYGKRSNIDHELNRNFISKRSNWLAVKSHFKGDLDPTLVGLHNFNGGYCGISKIENNVINVCYLTDYESFKQYKNIDDFQKNVMYKNPYLRHFFESSTMIFDKPMSISQISFRKKNSVENHILMIGDTAGLIHPLCGNGMAMAVHSAKIAAELLLDFFNEKNDISRENLELHYTKKWNSNFGKRLKMARYISRALQKPKLASVAIKILILFPSLLIKIVRNTHGNAF